MGGEKVGWVVVWVMGWAFAWAGAALPAMGQEGASVTAAAAPSPAAADSGAVAYVDAPLREVLADVRERTGVDVLYRDAVVAGVRVTIRTAPGDLIEALERAVRRHGLRLEVDRQRGQGLLTRAAAAPESVLSGQVVDAETGARLPLATVTWTDAETGRRRGVAAGEDGAFRLRLGDDCLLRDTLAVTASYVGYAPKTAYVDPSRPPVELTLRLRPATATAPEIVVQSPALQSDLDTTWQSLLRPERYAPLGESSVLSSVQTLPSVGLTPVLGGGLHVRGSRDDGFHVLLDGMSIYNQTHLFGLFDAFNAEALQAVGFFYGVAPVEYAAPPGGTLAFQTRTGSQAGVHVTSGLSPTAVSATVEGPLAEGQGSWLVSARHSILGAGWFGNDDLIAQGLGVDRSTEALPAQTEEIDDRLFLPGPPSARFYDVHATGMWETDAGQRWTLSTYLGGDDAEQGGRRIRVDENPTPRERFRDRDFLDTTAVNTENRWGNAGASLQWRAAFGETVAFHLTAAVSRYHSRYESDDFLYVRFRNEEPRLRTVRSRFAHENELVETSLTHRLLAGFAPSGTWTGGYAVRFYDVTYAEDSSVLGPFSGGQQSVQADAFTQFDATLPGADLRAGMRVHYFSQGAYLRTSPRLQVRMAPNGPVSVSAGYSRNHQFLHRLELVGDVSSPVWIPSTTTQPPGVVDQLTAGVSARPFPATAVQVEGYWKAQRNLRLHDTVARLRRTDDSVLMDPWTVENDARARGMEVMVKQEAEAVTWTGAYTISRVDVDPQGSADTRPADWDRRHQVTSRVVWRHGDRWTAHATWSFASGPPNPYAPLPREPDRLGAYHRLDVGASLRGTVDVGGRAAAWTVRGTLFNAYDRANPWYRTPVGVLRPDGPDPNQRRDAGLALVDVYDLGVRPSLILSVRW